MSKSKYQIILWFFIGAYAVYFSYFTILRFQTLYASYFDLGIMHQTVYNTYQAIASWDWSRFLELTNPFGSEQIKRMAIHNDILLALLAPFYFIYSGPETLLVIQTAAIALGAFGIYKIAQIVFGKNKYKDLLSLVFSLSYLLYPPLQRVNLYEFHAVALVTSFIIFMFYFWLVKRYKLSLLFLILSLLSKEQVGLTTAFFGAYALLRMGVTKRHWFPITVIALSVLWFILSIFVIIPYFRGSNHFALSYYNDFGDSPLKVMIGIFNNPSSLTKYIFHIDTFRYLLFMLGPLGFISIFAPLELLISLPEWAINLLSKSWAMRSIVFHYTAVIQPFVFIAAIYGARKLIRINFIIVITIIIISTLVFAYFKGPLPYSLSQEIHPFKYPQKEYKQLEYWKDSLKDEKIKVSSTGQLAPHFTSRRYFYTFSDRYVLADFIVIRPTEIYNYPEKEELIPVYEKLVKDNRFKKIHDQDGLVVYKKNPKSK
ncbi:MAG: DUF2079 domain-containing protein [Candidatus Roizmanbacteria bacterium]|nr:MAG: DUF2079 domain-containing protein [Candidatus Roizmanbacteria bacterium]